MVDIASRIRAKLSKRRHSSSKAPSLASSRSAVDDRSSHTSHSHQGHSHGLGQSYARSSLSENAASGKRSDPASPYDAATDRHDSQVRTWNTDVHTDESVSDAARSNNRQRHDKQQQHQHQSPPLIKLQAAPNTRRRSSSAGATSPATGATATATATATEAARPATTSVSSPRISDSTSASANATPSAAASSPADRDSPATSTDRHHQLSSSAAAAASANSDHDQTQPVSGNLHRIKESTLPSISPPETSSRPSGDNKYAAGSNNHNSGFDTGGEGDDEKEDDHHPHETSPRARVIPTHLRPSVSQSASTQLSPASASFPASALFGARSLSVSSRPPHELSRQQSLVGAGQSSLIHNLLNRPSTAGGDSGVEPLDAPMTIRKIWVKRPGASATLVPINEGDLVDDVRDLILRKYANSLGKTFDSPDLTIRIHPRDAQHSTRVLGPEEHMCETLDNVFPGGQTVDEALLIDIPTRRTPKASPRVPVHYYVDDGRPSEAGEGYFPPVGAAPSPHLSLTAPIPLNGGAPLPHSISVLSNGHIPPIPSPGGGARSRHSGRPRYGRTHTSSPTVLANGNPSNTSAGPPTASHGTLHFPPRPTRSRTHSESSEQHGLPPPTANLPKSPGAEVPMARTATPPLRTSSPRPGGRTRRNKKAAGEQLSLTSGLLSNNVPPINVLIVEDNPINLKLLEAFVKRLKVRWQTAMNGRDAVKKWRTGGFHLVLMDIQLPLMNGLDATREIRRLERVNTIGVFSASPGSVPDTVPDEVSEQDRLPNPELFKSPVIIVALTASSLQSDRHDALAAGCNDFLTKPVNFEWLERKVREWGCMQALIDFDGWRKWKDFSAAQDEENKKAAEKKAAASKSKMKKSRSSLTSAA